MKHIEKEIPVFKELLNISTPLVGWLKEKALFLIIGRIAGEIILHAFDYLLYPFVIWRCGLLTGGVIMAVFSLIACYATLVFYIRTQKDWFGIELAKGLREYTGRRTILCGISWILKRSEFACFLFLAVKSDPFTTVAYMRHGVNEFPKMDSRDWKIFLASWVIGNLSWLMVVFAGVSAAEAFWKIVR